MFSKVFSGSLSAELSTVRMMMEQNRGVAAQLFLSAVRSRCKTILSLIIFRFGTFFVSIFTLTNVPFSWRHTFGFE
jgi:hypothetical protein